MVITYPNSKDLRVIVLKDVFAAIKADNVLVSVKHYLLS